MSTRHRPARRTAAVAAALAVTGLTAFGVVAGTASAAGTGTCTQTVNVRSQPSQTAPIVGTCEQGQSTRVGETTDGFVKLDEFGGWASKQYVSDGAAGAAAPNQAPNQAPAQARDTGSLLGRGGSGENDARPAGPREGTSPAGSEAADGAGTSGG